MDYNNTMNHFVKLEYRFLEKLSLAAAVLLCELMGKKRYYNKEWFPASVSDIEARLHMERRSQARYLKELKNAGYISVKRVGNIANRFISILPAAYALAEDSSILAPSRNAYLSEQTERANAPVVCADENRPSPETDMAAVMVMDEMTADNCAEIDVTVDGRGPVENCEKILPNETDVPFLPFGSDNLSHEKTDFVVPQWDRNGRSYYTGEKQYENFRRSGGEVCASRTPSSRKAKTDFVKPTQDEVSAYIAEKGYRTLSAVKFMAYYSANGWHFGKALMNDWKSAVDYWKTLDENRQSTSGIYESGQCQHPIIVNGVESGFDTGRAIEIALRSSYAGMTQNDE